MGKLRDTETDSTDFLTFPFTGLATALLFPKDVKKDGKCHSSGHDATLMQIHKEGSLLFLTLELTLKALKVGGSRRLGKKVSERLW